MISRGICGGYKKYLDHIIPLLSRSKEISKISFFSPSVDEIFRKPYKIDNIEYENCPPFKPFSSKLEEVLEKALSKFSPDVIFIPIHRYIRFKNIPVVNMLHNMEPFYFEIRKYPIKEAIRLLLLRKETTINLRNSSRVIAISKFVRDCMIEKMKIVPQKIGLVYFGINSNEETLFPQKPEAVPIEWKGNFIFSAGGIRPSRGLEDILTTLKELFAKRKDNLNGLVIAGEPENSMLKYHQKLKTWVSNNKLDNQVIWTKNIAKHEMKWCYENCKLFVMTSRIEACPNIALESMNNGCVSIVANNPPLPEFFSNAAIYYEPMNTNELLTRIIQLIENADITSKLSQEARKRALDFTWEKTAQQTIHEIQTVLLEQNA